MVQRIHQSMQLFIAIGIQLQSVDSCDAISDPHIRTDSTSSNGIVAGNHLHAYTCGLASGSLPIHSEHGFFDAQLPNLE